MAFYMKGVCGGRGGRDSIKLWRQIFAFVYVSLYSSNPRMVGGVCVGGTPLSLGCTHCLCIRYFIPNPLVILDCPPHAGLVDFLEKCKELGTYIIVGLHNDWVSRYLHYCGAAQ